MLLSRGATVGNGLCVFDDKVVTNRTQADFSLRLFSGGRLRATNRT